MRLKDISQLNPSYIGESFDDEVSFVPMESLRNGDIDLKEIRYNEGKGKYTYFGNGDLLIAKVTPCFENGNIAVANNLLHGVGFGSSEIFVLRMNELALSTYMFYVSQTSKFKDSACATMCGVGGLKRISPLFMRTYELNIPSISEQQRIVDYLDKKLSAIDRRVSVLEKQRDAYMRLKKSMIHQAVTCGLNPNVPLKDSGVEWIGMIPEHWVRYRLKDMGYMYGGLTGKSGDDFRCDDLTMTKPYIPYTNILNHAVIDNDNFHYVIMGDDENQNRVESGDLLFLMSSEDYESIAKSAVVMGNPGEVYLNSFCRGLRITNKECYTPFVNYQLNSETYRDALRFEARGFTRINIKVDRVAGHFITLPPLSEQRAIAAYLDEKCAKIDAAVENIGKQIDVSKRLKRAIINEAISGKTTI